ncbi:NADH oxidase [Companilactobacillus nantensis]|uniref:NADH oxidase n=2 Tax=Companilactobacillus nantensis TaxID=305793 RepID=A0A0R1WTU3_9LACO|nr:NADH oxidase [Companilactobacillus nantensis DSM 16982]GEO63536.1 NADH oxidase [Companilactobacillus nantensis]
MKQILKYYPDADITVYERHAEISYLSCGTYLHLGGEVKNLDDVFYANPDEFTKQGVKMRMIHDVISINAKEHSILAQNLKTKELVHDSYDKLIMATGSITAIPAISGIENPKVMLCKTCDQAHELYAAAKTYHTVAIVGAGYAGVELAEGYIKSGHEVVLIERGPHVLKEYMDPEMSKKVEIMLVEHGVKVLTNTTVTQFSDLKNEKVNVKTTSCDCSVDMVAIAPGVIPQSDLLKGQVDLSKNGAIVTDPYMGTSDPDIFAAGDATEVRYNPTLGQAYIPLASHAVRQGTLAGINVLDKRLKSIGTQATTGMLLFGKTIACTGLTHEKAKAANFNTGIAYYHGNYRPDFMPTTAEITIELVYDRNTRKVLGAQMMSDHEVSQSANTISVVIQNGNTIDELAFLDMLFSPNFDEPFNYLNLVAQAAVDQEHGYWRK